jgi:hypothetical protein
MANVVGWVVSSQIGEGWQKIAKDLLSNSPLTGEGDEACPQ